MVSNSSIIAIVVVMILSVAIPLGMLFFLKNKYEIGVRAFFFGCIAFILFPGMLEQLFHSVVQFTPLWDILTNNILLYAIYGGVAAGFFEETARFIVMNNILTKEREEPHTALMYGAGHGGMEAIFIVGSAMVNNLIYANLINAGKSDILLANLPANQVDTMTNALNQLVSAKWYDFFTGIIERIPAIAIHISLSILIWIAIVRIKPYFYLIAVFIHALVDGLMVIVSSKLSDTAHPVLFTEIFIFVEGIIVVSYAIYMWKKYLAPAKK